MTLYDGHDFSSLFEVVDPETVRLVSEVDTVDVPARDGQVVRGRRWGKAEVGVTLVVEGDPYERQEKLSILASWLDVDGARPLYLEDRPGMYYMAVMDGGFDPMRYIGAESVRVPFLIAEPAAYGAEKRVTVPSGGSAQVVVGGTYRAHLRIAGTVTRDSSTGLYGIRADGGDFMHVATGSSAARAIEIDTEARTCRVAGAATLPELDSDWISLRPGTHTIANDLGGGDVVVSWTERWL